MWTAKKLLTGRWVCENENLDTTDRQFSTQEEAAAWAAESNSKHEARVAANKAKAAARNVARAKLQEKMPTDILTSRGDGWEGNS